MTPNKIFSMTIPLLLTFALTACEKDPTSETTESQSHLVRPARVATALPYTASEQRVFPAIIQAGKKADLAFRVAGQLIELPIVPGTSIKEGDVLAKVDATDFQNSLDGRVAQFDLVETQYKQIRSLFKKKYSSQAEVDSVTAQLTAAEVAVRQARTSLGYTTIRAPFDAVVAKVNVENFQFIQPQQTIVELQASNELDVQFDIPESLVKSMNGSNAYRELCGMVDFGSRNSLGNFKACYKEHDSIPDPTTRTYPVLFTLQDAEKASILPGMSVDFKLDLTSLSAIKQSHGSLLPLEAVFDENDKQWVWLLDAELKVHKSEVTVGGITNDLIHITSGVDSGAKVVSAGVSYLTEGQQVRVFEKERGL